MTQSDGGVAVERLAALIAEHDGYTITVDGWTMCLCGHVTSRDDDDGLHALHVAEVLAAAGYAVASAAAAALRGVAKQMAARLSHAACGQHPGARPDPACPYCADRTAYGAWLALIDAHGSALGLSRPVDPTEGAESVPVDELIRRHNAGETVFRVIGDAR